MIDPADWERMSWHARQKYMRRVRQRPVPTQPDPEPVPETLSTSPEPVRKNVRPYAPFRNDGIVRRCTDCGAWMIDVCHTDHGKRYAY